MGLLLWVLLWWDNFHQHLQVLGDRPGDFLGPSELVVDKKEVKYKSTQYEQHAVEIFPGWRTDDGGQDQENRYENHNDRDEDGHLDGPL